MLEKLAKKLKNILQLIMLFVIFFDVKVFAAGAPTEDEVNEIARKGLVIFFGTLAGFAVVFGGIELYGAFMAHRENVEQGGFGAAKDKVQKKIIAGVMCLIAASIIFIVMRWTQGLFDLA